MPEGLKQLEESSVRALWRSYLGLDVPSKRYNPKAGPGLPWVKLYPSQAKLVESMGEELIEIAWTRLTNIMNTPIENSMAGARKMYVDGLWDPYQVLTKREPHPPRKVQLGQWRLVFADSMVNRMIELVYSMYYNNACADNWKNIPEKPGMGFGDEGVHALMSEMRQWRNHADANGHKIVQEDVKTWDHSTKEALHYGALRVRIGANRCEGTPMETLMRKCQVALLYPLLITMVDFAIKMSYVFQRNLPGGTLSGRLNTAADNSLENVILMYSILAILARAMGDDGNAMYPASMTVEALVSAYAERGFTLREVAMWDHTGGEFCSSHWHLATGRRQPLSVHKMLANYLSSDKFDASMYRQFMMELEGASVEDLAYVREVLMFTKMCPDAHFEQHSSSDLELPPSPVAREGGVWSEFPDSDDEDGDARSSDDEEARDDDELMLDTIRNDEEAMEFVVRRPHLRRVMRARLARRMQRGDVELLQLNAEINSMRNLSSDLRTQSGRHKDRLRSEWERVYQLTRAAVRLFREYFPDDDYERHSAHDFELPPSQVAREIEVMQRRIDSLSWLNTIAERCGKNSERYLTALIEYMRELQSVDFSSLDFYDRDEFLEELRSVRDEVQEIVGYVPQNSTGGSLPDSADVCSRPFRSDLLVEVGGEEPRPERSDPVNKPKQRVYLRSFTFELLILFICLIFVGPWQAEAMATDAKFDNCARRCQLTEAGRDYAKLVLDPFHDTNTVVVQQPSVAPLRSYVQSHKAELSITKPSFVTDGKWDAHFLFCPTAYCGNSFDSDSTLGAFSHSCKIQNLDSDTGNVYGSFQDGSNIGEAWPDRAFLIVCKVAAGNQAWVPSVQHEFQYIQWSEMFGTGDDPMEDQSRARLIAGGYEIVNATEELYRGGTAVDWNMEPGIVESSVLVNDGLVLTLPTATDPIVLVLPATKHAMRCNLPPTTIAQAKGINGVSRSAIEGSYVTLRLSGPEAIAAPGLGAHVMVSQEPTDNTEPNWWSGANITYAATGVAGEVTGPTFVNMALLRKCHFKMSGSIYAGLNAQAVLSFISIAHIEVSPEAGDPLAGLAHPGPAYDDACFELIAQVQHTLLAGYPVGDNEAGEFWRKVVAAVAKYAGKVAQYSAAMAVIPGPIGAYARGVNIAAELASGAAAKVERRMEKQAAVRSEAQARKIEAMSKTQMPSKFKAMKRLKNPSGKK